MTSLYDVSKRVSTRYEWKLLSSLICELKPAGLPLAFASEMERVIEARDFSLLKQLAEDWSPRCLCDQFGYSVHACALVYQATSFIRKFATADKDMEEARESAASTTFYSAESRCARANAQLPRDLAFPESDAMVDCLTYARQFIRRVIGEEVDLADVYKGARPGVGQSYAATKGGKVTSFYKHSDPCHWTVTAEALPYVLDYITTDDRTLQAYEAYFRFHYTKPASRNQRRKGTKFVVVKRKHPFVGPLQPGWLTSLLTIVDGNRVTTVPKDAFTKRTIAIEPGLNLQLQLGVEDVFRRKLKRWGIDLDDQSKNQNLAKLSSVTGSHSTIDLKAASDTISIEIVRFLFPSEWFIIMDALRSHHGEYGSDVFTYEKISSMGNGFTFALESLIFASLTYACYKCCGIPWDHDDVAVYGDDVVCRTEVSLLLTELFAYCGFSVNLEKSFFHGSFRESCGADFIDGVDIRPVFHKEPVEYVDDVFVLHNQLYLWLHKNTLGHSDSPTLKKLKVWVPEQLMYYGPFTESTNTHLFRELQPDSGGHFRFSRVVRKPTVYKHNSEYDFFFKRLMNRLSGDLGYEERKDTPLWMRGHVASKRRAEAAWLSYKDTHLVGVSSVYDVTRRDAFAHSVSKFVMPSWQEQTLSLQ